MHTTGSEAKTTTAGRTISWGFAYDHVIALLTLGRENVIRDATLRAIAFYRDRPADWHRVLKTAMRQDWSWDRSAAEYERLYTRLIAVN